LSFFACPVYLYILGRRSPQREIRARIDDDIGCGWQLSLSAISHNYLGGLDLI